MIKLRKTNVWQCKSYKIGCSFVVYITGQYKTGSSEIRSVSVFKFQNTHEEYFAKAVLNNV